jgi:hypothetical protein
VAAALGTSHGTRAIVAYDGNAAEQPLAIYLRGAGFSYSGIPADEQPVAVSEIDVVGDVGQTLRAHLPAGIHLIDSADVTFYVVDRFALRTPRTITPEQAIAVAPALLGPQQAGSGAVLVQPERAGNAVSRWVGHRQRLVNEAVRHPNKR